MARCLLALDLGTSSFKAGVVVGSELITEPIVVPYDLDIAGESVTCPPERYIKAALDSLRAVAQTARAEGLVPDAIGIASQAQTFVALDDSMRPIGDAIVWTDNRGAAEAAALNERIASGEEWCGFAQLTGLQFLPKVAALLKTNKAVAARAKRFLLLNEYIAFTLTEHAFSDTTSQGMGGFYDIGYRCFADRAFELTGIDPGRLSPEIGPAGLICHPLSTDIAAHIGLPHIPVYLCGNDQTCSAAGVLPVDSKGVLCNFGTAMVAYSRRSERPIGILPDQIGGIDPLTGRYFLLGVESECGNVIQALANRLFPEVALTGMLQRLVNAGATVNIRCDAEVLTLALARHGELPVDANSGYQEKIDVANAVIDRFASRLTSLLAEMGAIPDHGEQIAAGGLAKSDDWLSLLTSKTGQRFKCVENEQAALIGIAKILKC